MDDDSQKLDNICGRKEGGGRAGKKNERREVAKEKGTSIYTFIFAINKRRLSLCNPGQNTYPNIN